MSSNVPAGIVDARSVSFLTGTPTPPAHTDLDQAERDLFDADLKRLASFWSRDGAGSLGQLWLEDRDTLLWAASIAKKQLQDLPFRGLKALGSSSFGMQPIRSVIINTTQTWLATYAATGWTTDTWDVNLANTTGTVRNTQNRVTLCATRYVNYAATPKIKEAQHQVGPTTYPVEVLEWAYIADLLTSKPIGALYIGKNGTFETDFNVEFTGTDGTALWGLFFAQGDWLGLTV